MSFTTTNPWVQYSGNDSTTEFAFNHKIHDQGDVVVLLTVDATSVTTTQTIATHYTVAGVAEDAHDNTTPTITMVTPPATGETLTIYRQVDLIMDTNFGTNEFWQSLKAEKQLELLMMATQWLYLLVSRCAIGSLASDPVTTTLESILATTPLSDLSALVAKTTPVDADLLLLADSAASFANKKLTATNHWLNYLKPLVAALHYLKSEHKSTSAGAGDAGKPIVLDVDGQVDATMINDADVDHGNVGGLGDDDHTQYSLISSGAGAPSGAPSRVGLTYVDTTNDKVYMSAGTSGTADWKLTSRQVRHLEFNLVASDVDVATGTNLYGDYVMKFDGVFLQDDSNPQLLMANQSTAGITGTMVMDIHLDGTTIMNTNKLDIETGEKTTETAATQPDLTTTTFTKGQILTIDCDAIHSGTVAKGSSVSIAVLQNS